MDIKEIMIHNFLLTFGGEEDAEDEYLVVEGPLQNSAGKQSRFTLSCHPSLLRLRYFNRAHCPTTLYQPAL